MKDKVSIEFRERSDRSYVKEGKTESLYRAGGCAWVKAHEHKPWIWQMMCQGKE